MDLNEQVAKSERRLDLLIRLRDGAGPKKTKDERQLDRPESPLRLGYAIPDSNKINEMIEHEQVRLSDLKFRAKDRNELIKRSDKIIAELDKQIMSEINKLDTFSEKARLKIKELKKEKEREKSKRNKY